MANEDNYKWVGVKYIMEHQSLWRVPIEWDSEQFEVKNDNLYYQGQKDPLLAVKFREKDCDKGERYCDWFETPDDIYVGTREELEDDIWFDCADVNEDLDGETDSEDSEEPIS